QGTEHIVAEEQAVTLLHVEKFDGKYIGGTLQLVASENQRGGMLLLGPPIHGGSQTEQNRERQVMHDTQQVEIGELGMKFSASGRAVEDHTLQIFSRRLTQPPGEFSELFLRDYISRNIFRTHEVP